MKIVILGGTGLIGNALQKSFSSNYQVDCFNRDAFQSVEHLISLIEGSDIVIQLSGSTISKRWSNKIVKEMWQSRVDTNLMLSEVIHSISAKPRVICASGISFYAESSCDEPKTEKDPQGDGYLTSLNIAAFSIAIFKLVR